MKASRLPCGKLCLLQNYKQLPLHTRGYHTVKKETPKVSTNNIIIDKRNKYRYYLMEDRKKGLISVRRTSVSSDMMANRAARFQNTARKNAWNEKAINKYKNLNATAKQKFRSFYNQKRFTPSASALLVLDKKSTKNGKNMDLVVTEVKKFCNEENDGKVRPVDDESDKEKMEDEQFVITKDRERYREYIYSQLQELKKENEKLKKRLVELSNDKTLDIALKGQNEDLELERTKLRACWLIMSSTMDAFSTFCKKFISKTDDHLLRTEEELHCSQEDQETPRNEKEDSAESSDAENKRAKTCDRKYFKFLEKLMDDRIESQIETETRSDMSK